MPRQNGKLDRCGNSKLGGNGSANRQLVDYIHTWFPMCFSIISWTDSGFLICSLLAPFFFFCSDTTLRWPVGEGQWGTSDKEPVQGEGSPSGGEDAVQSGCRQHRWAQPPCHSFPGCHYQRDHGSDICFKSNVFFFFKQKFNGYFIDI